MRVLYPKNHEGAMIDELLDKMDEVCYADYCRVWCVVVWNSI